MQPWHSPQQCALTRLSALQVYSTSAGMEFIHIASVHQLAIKALSFSPDGKRLAAAGDDDRITLIRVDIHEGSSMLANYQAGPNTRFLSWDPDTNYLVSVQTTGDVTVWDSSTMEVIWHERCAPEVRHSTKVKKPGSKQKNGDHAGPSESARTA